MDEHANEACYDDDGISGFYGPRHRPGLRSVLAAIESGQADGAVARDVDRWARNRDHHGRIWSVAQEHEAPRSPQGPMLTEPLPPAPTSRR